eukprot:TRINITY_DN12596_c0_g1_i1.p1 TRINITY_DN12596_c0_g1~~TRINITY_DN12596_c0_g1_i1.p1  ORF type:complete len:320 (+),score=59.60 TRINITY_DN12596_c0_g1_i1:70-1029(+)
MSGPEQLRFGESYGSTKSLAHLESAPEAIAQTTSTGQSRRALLANNKQKNIDQSYKWGDAMSLVKLPHEVDLAEIPDPEKEPPGIGGEYIKSIVFGGLDGIVTTFALVAGLAGAKVHMGTLIAVGLAKVVADAFSMGFGEYASATAELEYGLKVKARAECGADNHMSGEAKQLVELYTERGCQKDDALTLLTIMSNYRDVFVEHMLMMEHGILAPEEDDHWAEVKQGLVCFLSFIAFGMIPLVGFIVVHAIDKTATADTMSLLISAYVLTAMTLFVMGVTKAKLIGQEGVFKSGFMMMANGTIAGAMSYMIGQCLVPAL